MKLHRIKCTQCQRDFFMFTDDFNNIKMDEGSRMDFYACCPFNCDVIVGEQTLIDLGTVEFDDRRTLDGILIQSIADRLTGILHEVENMGVQDEAE